jgi:hypothetical protein
VLAVVGVSVCPAMNQGTFKYRNLSDNQEESSLKLIHQNLPKSAGKL